MVLGKFKVTLSDHKGPCDLHSESNPVNECKIVEWVETHNIAIYEDVHEMKLKIQKRVYQDHEKRNLTYECFPVDWDQDSGEWVYGPPDPHEMFIEYLGECKPIKAAHA